MVLFVHGCPILGECEVFEHRIDLIYHYVLRLKSPGFIIYTKTHINIGGQRVGNASGLGLCSDGYFWLR